MNNRITELEINNFKSIKHIKMDCKRINVLIGRPNTGKSNILEALCLFEAPYYDSNKSFLKDYIRYEKLSNLFYDQDRKNQISVITNLGFAALWYNSNVYRITISPDEKVLENIKKDGVFPLENDPGKYFRTNENQGMHRTISTWHGIFNDDIKLNGNFFDSSIAANPIKKYHFKTLTEHKNCFSYFLTPPYGENLYAILEGHPELWEECAGIFNNYGLDLLLDAEYEKIEVQKKIGRRVTKIPYSLAADTLQRFIFHLAAIDTNSDSVLLFEEPESHLFPPYIIRLAERIIENKSNQFFIATHSSEVLMTFLEQSSWDELAIFITDYSDYETNIRQLNKDEMQSVLDDGIDLLFNLRAFQE